MTMKNLNLLTDECVIWQHAVNSGGYPVVWENGHNTYVTRVIMGARKGEVVMHLCDNPSCINKNHLKIGTPKENSQDMVNKGRSARGEKCGSAKLKENDVLDIRKLNGVLPSRTVAKIYNISKTNVLDIWRNKIWCHL